VHLKDLIGKKTLVVYFYPKDDTPGCTVEACSFRDSYEDFVKAGADVIGISADKEDSHKDFKSKHNLPFRLMTDSDGSARKAFGVKATLGIIAGRVTFVIDTQGVVQHAFNSQLRAGKHVEEALAVVKRLAGGPKAA
jgi:peroxiredoxin Q/BCP